MPTPLVVTTQVPDGGLGALGLVSQLLQGKKQLQLQEQQLALAEHEFRLREQREAEEAPLRLARDRLAIQTLEAQLEGFKQQIGFAEKQEARAAEAHLSAKEDAELRRRLLQEGSVREEKLFSQQMGESAERTNLARDTRTLVLPQQVADLKERLEVSKAQLQALQNANSKFEENQQYLRGAAKIQQSAVIAQHLSQMTGHGRAAWFHAAKNDPDLQPFVQGLDPESIQGNLSTVVNSIVSSAISNMSFEGRKALAVDMLKMELSLPPDRYGEEESVSKIWMDAIRKQTIDPVFGTLGYERRGGTPSTSAQESQKQTPSTPSYEIGRELPNNFRLKVGEPSYFDAGRYEETRPQDGPKEFLHDANEIARGVKLTLQGKTVKEKVNLENLPPGWRGFTLKDVIFIEGIRNGTIAGDESKGSSLQKALFNKLFYYFITSDPIETLKQVQIARDKGFLTEKQANLFEYINDSLGLIRVKKDATR